MTNNDIIALYEKGYSIDYIIKEYMRFKNRNCVKNHYFNDIYIITKKNISKNDCKKYFYEVLLNKKINSPVSNKAN